MAPMGYGTPVSIEALILAGGSSRRMGQDKAGILVGGVPSIVRIANALIARGMEATVLGGEPIKGTRHIPDEDPGAGPLAALASFLPDADSVFVASCDLVRFDARVVDVLLEALLESPWPGPIALRRCAAVPEIEGRLQPLCALYTRSSMGGPAAALARGARRVMDMLETIEVIPVYEGAFVSHGVDPRAVLGANTPDELRTLLTDDPY